MKPRIAELEATVTLVKICPLGTVDGEGAIEV